MTNYYIEKNGEILIVNTDRQVVETTLLVMPDSEGLEVKETERPIVLSDDLASYVFADTDEYLQEQLQKAKEAKIQEATSKAYAYEQTDALITVKATNTMTRVSDLYHIEGHFTNMIKISAYAQSMSVEDILPWNTKENVNVFLNKTGCAQLSALMQQMNVKLWTVAFPTYLAQIEACKTADEVNAISIEYVNPDEIVDLTSNTDSGVTYSQSSFII